MDFFMKGYLYSNLKFSSSKAAFPFQFIQTSKHFWLKRLLSKQFYSSHCIQHPLAQDGMLAQQRLWWPTGTGTSRIEVRRLRTLFIPKVLTGYNFRIWSGPPCSPWVVFWQLGRVDRVRKPTLCFGALLLQGGVNAARCYERANAEETKSGHSWFILYVYIPDKVPSSGSVDVDFEVRSPPPRQAGEVVLFGIDGIVKT